MKQLSLIACLIACSLMMTTACQFDRVDPVIWIPMGNAVEAETTIYGLDLTYASPCPRIMLYKPKHADKPFLERDDDGLYDEIVRRSNEYYETHWKNRLDELTYMQRPSSTVIQRGLIRNKRNPFIIIGGGLVLTIVLVTNLINSRLSEVVPGGDGYRIRELQKQEELDKIRLDELARKYNQ